MNGNAVSRCVYCKATVMFKPFGTVLIPPAIAKRMEEHKAAALARFADRAAGADGGSNPV